MKSVFSFIFCILISAALAYYITGTGGIFVFTLLIFGMIFDLVIAVFSSKKLKVSLELSAQTVNKGDTAELLIVSDNGSFMPSGIVQIEIDCTPNISIDGDKIYRFITAGRNASPIKLPITADFSGAGSIYIKELIVTDFLGMRRKKLVAQSESCKLKILPRIPDTGTQSEIIKSVSDSVVFDDSEEESDETSLIPTGIAGYEHRQYVPGDPLKRINWKISSKKNTLMVRLDEKSVSAGQIFVLDFPMAEPFSREYAKNADLIIEASLAMLSMLIKQGFESEYNLCVDGVWESIPIDDEKSLQYLQEKLSGITPYPNDKRFPPVQVKNQNKGYIYFTSCTSDMQKQLNGLLENFSGALAVTKDSGIEKTGGFDVWSVDENCQFTKL